MDGFYRVVNEAVAWFAEHGYTSQRAVEERLERIRAAAKRQMIPEAELVRHLRERLGAIYKRLLRPGGLDQYQIGMPRFTLANVKPKLRAELDRRVLASANLIKLNREQSIQRTLQRFQGWATSIPAGGSDATKRRESATEIRKALTQLPFEERRVAIDQGHKLVSAINSIVAHDGGAIAAKWRSHWRQANYDYREDHKERDFDVSGHLYLTRDSWAHERGYVKPGKAGYLDEVTQPGEEPFCRCYCIYVFSLNKMPDDMLTEKGREARDRAKRLSS